MFACGPLEVISEAPDLGACSAVLDERGPWRRSLQHLFLSIKCNAYRREIEGFAEFAALNSESFYAGSGENGVVLFHTYLSERIVISLPQSADSAYFPISKSADTRTWNLPGTSALHVETTAVSSRQLPAPLRP